MKPSTELNPELVDNRNLFDTEFYNRFTLRHADEPLKLSDDISKNYLFPTFYGNVTCGMGIFLCSYEKAQNLLPDQSMKPVSMGKGRALVIISCYEYKNVLGIKPYNEIAFTIPIMVNASMNIPVLPVLMGNLFKSFGYYCFSMPVTSYENQLRGLKIWGLPKVVQEIQIQKEGDFSHVQAFEESGEKYLDLKIPMTGPKTKFDVTSNLYTKKDNKVLQNETNFQGDFNVVKNIGLLFNDSKHAEKESLWVGSTPSAKHLNDLEINTNPFQFRYCEDMSSCFDLPNPDYQLP